MIFELPTAHLYLHLCCCFLQESVGGMRGSPLAMLAAQCNKLTTKSPPPLADAAVGKGFHPWKKCTTAQSQCTTAQSLSSGVPEESSSQPASPAQSNYSHSPNPQYGERHSDFFSLLLYSVIC